MTEEEKQDLVDSVTKAVVAAQKIAHEEHREYWVDREDHYKHHQFIDSFIEFMDTSKRFAWGTVVTFFVVGILGLLAFGFWEKLKHFGG